MSYLILACLFIGAMSNAVYLICWLIEYRKRKQGK